MMDTNKVKEVIATFENPVEQEQSRLAKLLVVVLSDSEDVWKQISDRQAIMHRLYIEQIHVSGLFSLFTLTLRFRNYPICENITTLHQYMEVNEEVQFLLSCLKQFEQMLDQSGKIIRDAIKDMRIHLAKLRQQLEGTKGAKTLEDLKDIYVPDLEWIYDIPDPGVQYLAEEWDFMKLEQRMNQLLIELRMMIHDYE